VSKETSVQPEEVLELICSAPQHYDTVRAALRYRGDGSTMRTVRDRYRASEAYRLETGGSPDSSEEIGYPEPDGPFGWRSRVWYAKVSPERGVRDRLEVELPREVYPDGGVYISAWDGRVSGPNTAVRARIGGSSPEEDPPWLDLAQDSFWSNYLFDFDGIAGFPLGSRELSVQGETRKAGREAIRLVGVPEEEWDYWPEPLWWGADEYEFLVDSERGVLLRCASRLGGKDIDALEVEELHFDEELPEDVFSSRERLPWR
jgi:hypothetical protein